MKRNPFITLAVPKVFLVWCWPNSPCGEVRSVWTSREKAVKEMKRLVETDDNGIRMYGYELGVEEHELDSP